MIYMRYTHILQFSENQEKGKLFYTEEGLDTEADERAQGR
jgi:hypothetical protein